MSTTPRVPIPTGRNLMFGRCRALLHYAVSKRGKFMVNHSLGSAVAYGGTALAMAVFLLNFRPILGRVPYIKNSYPLPEPEHPKKK